MRDDLHRTVPLPRPWRAVVKIAYREADFEKLPTAISKAVRREIEDNVDVRWAAKLKSALEHIGGDMFLSDQVLEAIRGFERQATTPIERQLCEAARGLFARDEVSVELFERSLAAVCTHMLPSRIEHIVSQVRGRHGNAEAIQLRKQLALGSRDCTFGVEKKQSRVEAKKISIADLLNEPIRLKSE